MCIVQYIVKVVGCLECTQQLLAIKIHKGQEVKFLLKVEEKYYFLFFSNLPSTFIMCRRLLIVEPTVVEHVYSTLSKG